MIFLVSGTPLIAPGSGVKIPDTPSREALARSLDDHTQGAFAKVAGSKAESL
jgi:hypothetical protein